MPIVILLSNDSVSIIFEAITKEGYSFIAVVTLVNNPFKVIVLFSVAFTIKLRIWLPLT